MPPTGSEILHSLFSAKSTRDIEAFLATLSIADPNEYVWTQKTPEVGWQSGKLHWVPVGRERGNAGRIKLAGDPFNPAAERLINGMESLIELARQRELQQDKNAPPPKSPRLAVERYFSLPRLDIIPKVSDREKRRALDEKLRELRRQLSLRLEFDKVTREFCIEIADRGIGQTPARVHQTLLALGDSDKPDKPYLIGVFGQGGSSTYAASKYSVIITRRAPDVLGTDADGYGWTIVRKVSMKLMGRRDVVFAYLAAKPGGEVPFVSPSSVTEAPMAHGSVFRHLGYDFGPEASAISRTLYYSLNHVLFNPILPYDLYSLRVLPDAMYGTAYRLSRQTASLASKGIPSLDKTFLPQSI